MDALEILYDHYKETYELSKEKQIKRNKNFIILCLLEALSFLLLIRPEKAFEIILNGLNSEIGMTLQLSNTIIQTLIWILITYTMIQYVQDMLYVEHQYVYLNKLEKEISKLVSIFEREGDHYTTDYPMVLNFIDLFYKTFMPIFFAVINIIKICKEWALTDISIIARIADTVLCVSIIIIDWFYFFEIHTLTTEFCKKHIPYIKKVADKLRKILKKV